MDKQAQEVVDGCTPRQRKALIKRLKYTAKPLLSPLERKMLKVLRRQQNSDSDVVVTWTREPAKAKPKKRRQKKKNDALFSGLGQSMEQLALWSSENVKALQKTEPSSMIE